MTTSERWRAGELVGSVVLLGSWLVWVVAVSAARSHSLTGASPYLLAPLMVGLGALGGRLLNGAIRSRYVFVGLACSGLAFLVFAGFYANAVAALGVQLVGLAGLVLIRNPGENCGASGMAARLSATLLGICGILLAGRSQAASALVLVLGVICLLAMDGRFVARCWQLVAMGSGVVAISWLVDLWLGSRASWPSVLAASGSLSETRRRLWADALSLWKAHPITGAGPGVFREYSQTAASNSSLAMAHSSVLQVGAEFGVVGVVLFAGLLVIAMRHAARAGGAAALIGVSASTCLAVHSTMDHLYEYWPVTLVSGVVIGLAGGYAEETGTAAS